MFQFGPTVFDLLFKNLSQQHFITTYSKSLDELLHGGIALGIVFFTHFIIVLIYSHESCSTVYKSP